VEIFQLRGSYEAPPEEGNHLPEVESSWPPYAGGYVARALEKGWRVGFTAGGDDHMGQWGTEWRFQAGSRSYKQGLMSVEASELTREALFEALYRRRVVATTGARILLTYTLNGQPMGSELQVEEGTERTLSIEVHGTASVKYVDVICNNELFKRFSGEGDRDLYLEAQDERPLKKFWLGPAKFCNSHFTFYYVRVIQADGETAWASPTWLEPAE